MGVKSHRMQVMKASFFGESKETRQYIDNNRIKQDELTLGNKSVMNGSGFDEISVGERLVYSPVKIKSLTIHPDIFYTDVERSAKERRTGLLFFRKFKKTETISHLLLLSFTVPSPPFYFTLSSL